MANMLFANNCNTTLSGSLTNVATTMSVTSATGFPSPTGSQYFYCTLADAATQTTIEIVKVTAVSGTTFTIVRGQDGTTGTIFASGAVVSLRLVAASLNDFPKLDEANTFTGTITFSTPLLATNMVQSTTSTSGYLSNTDWSTFNGKAPAVTYTSNYIPYGQGTTTPNQSAGLQFDGTNFTTTGYATATSFIPSSATVPTNGLYLPAANSVGFSTATTERMRIDSSGNVSVGATASTTNAIFEVASANKTQASGTGQLQLYSTNSMAADLGGQLVFGAAFTGTTTTTMAGISGRKENGTAGDIAGYCSIWTNQGGVGAVERQKISSTGIVTLSAYGAGAATFSASGVISSVSDETWKIKDGVPVNPDEMLQKLEPGYWFYNKEKAPIFGEDRQLGFYAQNVNKAIGNEAAPIPEADKPWGYYDRSVLAVTVMSLKNALNTIQELNAKFDDYVTSHP